MMAEAAPFISVPEKGKRNVANTAMVLNSLASTLPLVIPDASISIEDSKSAPNSPEREEVKKSKGFLKKHLPRPRSPHHHRRTSQSDPESSASRSPSSSPHQPRPRWLPFKSKKKKSPSQNGELSTVEKACLSVTDMISGSMSSLDLEATPVHRLPGGSSEEDNALVSSSNSVPEVCDISLFSSSTEGDGQATVEGFDRGTTVPEIRVSDERNEDVAEYTPQEPAGVEVPNRKNSQSSRGSSGSGLLSIGTSGLGSLLSPSGDECYSGSGSDIESPLSPYSGASSFTCETPGELSDLDPIERDFDSQENKDPVTTPIPGHGDDNSPISGDAKDLRRRKKDNKPNTVWMKVRNAVKAWSPFAVQFKKKYYPWVQLAGHEGNFMPGGENGTIMKKSDVKERNALRTLMNDPLKDFVPEFKGEVEQETGTYVEMTDLLRDFNEPAVMDIKMGIRTYLEEEIAKKHILRADMYQKMVDVDPNEPTPEEHAQAAISKPRYMQWRETLSSTSTLGFRIEGIKTLDGKALKNFKKTKRREDVLKSLASYVAENPSVKDTFYQRLLDIRETLKTSNFFRTHELIGSSLLFVYDASGLASVHMIDFGKTTPIPEGIMIDHMTEWVEGNHEDGYLFGLNNLIDIWKEI